MHLSSLSALLPWRWANPATGYTPTAARPIPGTCGRDPASFGMPVLDGPPDTVIYLAGDLSEAIGRISRLRAHGIEVLLGLGHGVPRNAALVIDAASFVDHGRIENCLGLARTAQAGPYALILYPDRSLLVPISDAPERVEAHPVMRQQFDWLSRVLRDQRQMTPALAASR